jgi:hypothetical protein
MPGFVGRERELALLHQAFLRVEETRQCEIVTVLGAAGGGKSRLVAEFVVSVGERARVLQGGRSRGVSFATPPVPTKAINPWHSSRRSRGFWGAGS